MSFAASQNPQFMQGNQNPQFMQGNQNAAPPAQINNPYADIGTVDCDDRGRRLYENPGAYDLEITEIADGVGKMSGKRYFGASFIVRESTNPSVQPGMTIQWSTVERSSPAYRKYFAEDIQRFLGAVFGVDPNTITMEILEKAKHHTQPARGRMVKAESYVTKEGKNRTRFAPAEASY